jgi:hypothetical protein
LWSATFRRGEKLMIDSVLFGQEHIGSDVNLLTMNVDKVSYSRGASLQKADEQDTLLEDMITYTDLLFGAEDMPQASALLPPGTALSRSGVISFHPVDDGPQPGSARTRYKVDDPGEPTTVLPTRMESIFALSPEGAGLRTNGDVTGQQANVIGGNKSMNAITKAEPITAAKSASESPFTPDEELDLLFDPSFIPQSLRDSLGPDLHVS